MNFFGKKSKREVKSNPAGGALMVTNALLFTPKTSPDVQFKDGYQTNVIVYRCITEIISAIANLDLDFYKGDVYQEKSQLKDLMNRPNPTQGWDGFIKAAFTDYLSTGEMFISAVKVGKQVREMWVQSPRYMHVKGGTSGLVEKFVFKNAGHEISWPVDQISGASDMFYFKMHNPMDYWRGQSPLQAAALSVDAHNNGLIWNNSLLENSGRPSGIVKFAGDPSSQTVERLRELFKKKIQGKRNAGEIPMLVDGADWQATDNNPRDMDFINTLKETSKYIASAYGVPLPLVDNDSASYNNIEQAKERLYTDTVIPIFNAFLNQFNNWMEPHSGGIEARINMDAIPALERLRKAKFDANVAGVTNGILTIDEARQALGYDPIGGVASTLLIPQGRIPLEMSGFEMTDDEMDSAEELRRSGFTDKEIKHLIIEGREIATCTHS